MKTYRKEEVIISLQGATEIQAFVEVIKAFQRDVECNQYADDAAFKLVRRLIEDFPEAGNLRSVESW